MYQNLKLTKNYTIDIIPTWIINYINNETPMTTIQPNFIEFRTFGARINSNFIAITSNGTISLYTGFVRKNHIESFSHCLILYDKELRIVALQFGNQELGNGAYKVNYNKERQVAYVVAGNFFRINEELSLSQLKGKYIPEKFNDPSRQNVFMIDLTKKIESK
ncbi:MAG: hypothetical protein V1928_02680 [Parcubacteria group bacterium]